MTALDQAVTQMMAAGMPPFPPGHPLTGTGVQRYGPKKKAFYKLYEDRARSGAVIITGYYGVWGEIELSKIEVDWQGIDIAERERMRRERAAEAAREAAKILQRAKFAANRSRQQWGEARKTPPEGVPTYLQRKGAVHESGVRYLADGTLLVPMIRYDVTDAHEAAVDYAGPLRLAGLQKITPDGTKRFNRGMAKVGTACRLGKAPSRGDLILIAEGIATALTLRMATEHKVAVFCAFDSGSLLPVTKILRALYPQSPILFCADDDVYLAASMNKMLRENYGVALLLEPPLTGVRVVARAGEINISAEWINDAHGVPGIVGAVIEGARTVPFARSNAGRTAAHAAAAVVGNASVIFPRFAQRVIAIDPDVGGRLTDFNDLHQAESLAVVAAQLADEIKRVEFSREVAKAVARLDEDVKREKKSQRKAEKPPEPGALDDLARRFTLIYPTDTVYDADKELIAKLATVKIAFGDAAIKWWLASPGRRTVDADRVVFDPSGKEDAATSINLFRGLAAPAALAPDAGCQRLLNLLQYLCGEADQEIAPITEWTLNWLAYPLQHVGAKMATAIVMHGPAEGTGKNLFFNSIRDMYGRYASLITQTQLESPYNGWMSQRLFVIANEVISRSELRHHVGRLKNLVTESPLPIEEKYMPLRYEVNHMNMVFLTNEFQALQISPSDRRYMVIRTPPVMPDGYYADVLAELAGGGVAALHQFLLARDLSGFGEHSKPLMTVAKAELIEMGMSSPQQFWRDLHDGLLHPITYGPAFWRDLFAVYGVWCYRNGIKNPRPSNAFAQEFMSMNGVRRVTQHVADPDKPEEFLLPADKRPQRVIYFMGERPADVEMADWRDAELKSFRWAARQYLKDRGIGRSGSADDEGGGNA